MLLDDEHTRADPTDGELLVALDAGGRRLDLANRRAAGTFAQKCEQL